MAFLLTPLSLASVAALIMLLLAFLGPGSRIFGATFSQALVVALWSPLLAYPVAFLLGFPLFVLARRYWRVTGWSCLVGGAAASLLGSLVVVAIEGADLATPASVGIFAAMSAIGAVHGGVFWLLLSRHRPAGGPGPALGTGVLQGGGRERR